MPSSPRTPSRGESRFSFDPSPNGYRDGHGDSPHSRKSSYNAPLTPRPKSSYGRNGTPIFLGDHTGFGDGGNDLGSLADELAEVWDEDGEGGEDISGLQMEDQDISTEFETRQEPGVSKGHHQRYSTSSSPGERRPANWLASPTKATAQAKMPRKQRQQDGMGCDHDSDLDEAPLFSPALEAQMAAIEVLALQGTEENVGQADDVILRVMNRLRVLGAQSSVENATSRFVPSLLHRIALTHHLTKRPDSSQLTQPWQHTLINKPVYYKPLPTHSSLHCPHLQILRSSTTSFPFS